MVARSLEWLYIAIIIQPIKVVLMSDLRFWGPRNMTESVKLSLVNYLMPNPRCPISQGNGPFYEHNNCPMHCKKICCQDAYCYEARI